MPSLSSTLKPTDIVYMKLLTGLEFIGKFSPESSDHALVLTDAFSLHNHVLAQPTPQGLGIQVIPLFMPVSAIANPAGDTTPPIPTDMLFEVRIVDLKHPLAVEYTKRTSRIQLV